LPKLIKKHTDLKKQKYHILHAWILLLCFVAGQYMVYAHQHKVVSGSNRAAYHNPGAQPHQTVSEDCQLCDTMHHNAMAVNSFTYFAPLVVTSHIYKAYQYAFISVAIIHSGGRSPPLA